MYTYIVARNIWIWIKHTDTHSYIHACIPMCIYVYIYLTKTLIHRRGYPGGAPPAGGSGREFLSSQPNFAKPLPLSNASSRVRHNSCAQTWNFFASRVSLRNYHALHPHSKICDIIATAHPQRT